MNGPLQNPSQITGYQSKRCPSGGSLMGFQMRTSMLLSQKVPRLAKSPLRARIAAGWVIWGFISMVGCVLSATYAGTCRYYSDGPDSVTACEDGSVIVRHQDGRVDRYGTPNAGFERYPRQENRPLFERRD
jgi:hypothetical protein